MAARRPQIELVHAYARLLPTYLRLKDECQRGVGDVKSRLLHMTEPGNDWLGKSADFVLACKQKSGYRHGPFCVQYLMHWTNVPSV